MIRKILSPIVYAVFLVLNIITFLLIDINMSFFRDNFPILIILTLLQLIIPGTFYFWEGNRLMKEIEKAHTLKISDHFRQSSLCYLTIILLLIIITPAIIDTKDATGHEFIITGLIIGNLILLILNSILAVFINAIFVYKHKKVKI
ncbi:MAG: hypothetical protein V1848_00255 [Candidatus Magasanikbacteria bacterium]